MAPSDETQPPASSCPIEAIAQAYLATTEGDEGQALRIAITDALADLMDADRRARAQSRLISRGYVRGGLDDGRPTRHPEPGFEELPPEGRLASSALL